MIPVLLLLGISCVVHIKSQLHQSNPHFYAFKKLSLRNLERIPGLVEILNLNLPNYCSVSCKKLLASIIVIRMIRFYQFGLEVIIIYLIISK